jgi:hypothetical protein
LARGWAISGVTDQTREAVMAAADATGMPVGAWIEQALTKALAEGLEAGVSIEEIETRLRQAVSDELKPMQQALARLEAATAAPPTSPALGDRPPSSLSERLRERRQRR